MSTLAFVTHPSVRIKGTENAYTPTQCLDDRCPVKAPHLHCPLCVKTDAYQDPVILKAHYRVKHVDKGIDFAGLKILRCCDSCDIIGIIKGEKKFKGAHWHCYRCRNGFNRRDEAIKHYKTHFRNPQTTFQIQITQDINSPPESRPHEDHNTSISDAFCSVQNQIPAIIRPAISQNKDEVVEQVKTIHGSVAVQNVKPDVLERGDRSHENEKTIMIIQGSQLETALASHIIDPEELSQLDKAHVDAATSWEIRFRIEEEEKNMYKSKMQEYKMQVDVLKQQVDNLENQLAQQRQLCFHELLDFLSSEDLPQRLAASEQVAKFLEQCQTFLPSASLPISRDQTGSLLVHSQPQEGETEQKQHTVANGLVHNLDSTSQSCQHEQNQKAKSTLGGVTGDLRVICTNGPVDSTMLITTTEGVGSEAESKLVSVQPSEVNHSGQGLFAEMLAQPQQQELHVQVVLPDVGTSDHTAQVVMPEVVTSVPTGHVILPEVVASNGTGEVVLPEIVSDSADQGLETSASPDNQDDTSGLINPECLMEVVAANGLATLGTDMTVISTSADGESHAQSQGAFMMTLDDGQKLILHQAGDTCVAASCHDKESGSDEEPERKRPKV